MRKITLLFVLFFNLLGFGQTLPNIDFNIYPKAQKNAVINAPAAISITTEMVVDATEFGTATGKIIGFKATGGTGALNQQWEYQPIGGSFSNFPANSDFNSLYAGTYKVTVTDAKLCTANKIFVINQPALITPEINIESAITCFGFNNAALKATATGGKGTLSFTWSKSASINGAYSYIGIGNVITGLQAGFYKLTVTDGNGISKELVKELTQPAPLACSISNILAVHCKGGANGSFTVNATGGSGNYNYVLLTLDSNGLYTIDNAKAINNASKSFENLVAGFYKVRIIDQLDGNCIFNSPIEIQITEPSLPLSIDVLLQKSPTGTNQNGEITVKATGGTVPYAYVWKNEQTMATLSSTNETITNLSEGSYTVTITDANGCQSNKTIILNALNVSITPATILCNNGTQNLTANPTGGNFIGNYVYKWTKDGDVSFIQTTQTAIGLTPGRYTVQVFDSNTSISTSFTLTEPTQIAATTPVITPVKCYNEANGSVTITVSGGTPTLTGYTYTLSKAGTINHTFSNGTDLVTISGLVAGNYNLTIKDNNDCTIFLNFNITQPNAAIALGNPTIARVTSQGMNNGSIVFPSLPTGGNGNYNYTWTKIGDPAFSNSNLSISNLSPGFYTLVVTDSKGCSYTTPTFEIKEILQLTLVSKSDVLCYGNATGQIHFNVRGGDPDTSANTPFYYMSWKKEGDSSFKVTTDFVINNLTVGKYTIKVTDINNTFVDNLVVTIEEPTAALNIMATSTNVTGFGLNNATINCTITGGTLPYTVAWTRNGIPFTVSNPTVLSGLGVGMYEVTVTDKNGCAKNQVFEIIQPPILAVSIVSPTIIKCFGDTGSVMVNATGGYLGINPGYNYTWYKKEATVFNEIVPQQNTNNPTGLLAGEYQVVVSVNGNSTTSSTINLLENPLFTCTVNAQDMTCHDNNDGFITIKPLGGISNYKYVITNTTGFNKTGIMNGDIIIPNLSNGNYTITVTENATVSCKEFIFLKTIVNPEQLLISGTVSHPTSITATDGEIIATVVGGKLPYTYVWKKASTIIPTNTINPNIQTGLSKGNYTLTVTDAGGCTVISNTFSLNPVEVSIAASPALKCFADTTTLTAIASGGVPNNLGEYTYKWTLNGIPIANTTPQIINTTGGNYSVIVKDKNGLSATATVNLLPITQIETTAIITTVVNCASGTDGTATLKVSGGTRPSTGYIYDLKRVDNIPHTAVIETILDTISQQETLKINNLNAGNYNLVVTDANNCIANPSNISFTITEPAPIALSTPTLKNIAIFGQSTGSIIFPANAISGGNTGDYTIHWTKVGDPTFNKDTLNIDHLTEGIYQITITDSRYNAAFDSNKTGCSYTQNFEIKQPAALTVSINETAPIYCFGTATGTLTAMVTGGVTPYKYQWFKNGVAITGQTFQNLTGMVAGNYSVTVTDTANPEPAGPFASTNFNYTLNEVAELKVSLNSKTDVLCFGNTTGAINIDIQGGTKPYTINWTNDSNTFFSTAKDLTGLASGVYTAIITDGHCEKTIQVVITTPATPLSITNETVTQLKGFQTQDGSIAVNIAGGTPPYTYAWTNNSNKTPTITNLAIGNYDLTVTDNNGCQLKKSYTITQPNKLIIASLNVSKTLCFGNNDATITSSITGGTKPYTCTWTKVGDNTFASQVPNPDNLNAGIYKLIVTDANGMVANWLNDTNGAEATATVLQYNKLIVSAKYIKNITCSVNTYIGLNGQVISNNSNDGEIEIQTIGGSGTIASIVWSNPSTTNANSYVNSGLLAFNQYSVTVTDTNGCSDTFFYSITNAPLYVTTELIKTPESTINGKNGWIKATVSGGKPNYTYQWYDATATNPIFVETTSSQNSILKDINGGQYYLTVTDGNGCQINQQDLNAINPLSVVVSKITDVKCYGDATGVLQAIANGGSNQYTYNWYNVNDTQNSIGTGSSIVLPAGTYYVKVSDSFDTKQSVNTTITQPTAPLSVSYTTAYTLCGDSGNWTITAINATGGTLAQGNTYTYWWDGVLGQNIYKNVSLGKHTLIIKDDNGCQSSLIEINIEKPLPLTVNFVPTMPLCNGDANGTIKTTITNGTLPYTYLWNTGSTTKDLDNVTAGKYTLTVTDAKGCMLIQSINITQPDLLKVVSITKNSPSSFASNDASIVFTIAGGTPNYIYKWYDANKNLVWTDSQNTTQSTLTNIVAGQYYVTVTDQNGCAIVQESIDKTNPLTVVTQQQAFLKCKGENNATIKATAQGGTPAYTYQWYNTSNPAVVIANTPIINNLSVGNYYVKVFDSFGKSIQSNTITITEPTIISLTLTADYTKCGDGKDWTIQPNVSGGTLASNSQYKYYWNGVLGNSTLTNTLSGSYTLIVYDDNNCSAQQTINLITPPAMTLSLAATNVTCFDGANGSINSTITNGVLPYTYKWSSGETTPTINNIKANKYTLTVTDAKGCVVTQSINVTQPNNFRIVQIRKVPPSAIGKPDASIVVNIIGGTAGYTYNWYDVQNKLIWTDVQATTQSTLSNIVAGQYYIEVIDKNGCMISKEAIDKTSNLVVSLQQIQTLSCTADTNASITATVLGGTPAYYYQWYNVNKPNTIIGNFVTLTNLGEGSYYVKVYDSFGKFVQSDPIQITQPTPIQINLSANYINCGDSNDWTINATVTGGTLIAPNNYQYYWNSKLGKETLTNAVPGKYTLRVYDQNNCWQEKTINIDKPAPMLIDLKISDIICYDVPDGSIKSTITNGTPPYQYLWSNGNNTPNINNVKAGIYNLQITDAKGCVVNTTATLTNPTPIIINLGKDVTLCKDQSYTLNGSIPDSKATYVWTSSNDSKFTSTNPIINITEPAIYTVVATSSLGCTITDSIVIKKETNVIDATFVSPTQVFLNERFVIVDISYPEADNITWILPAEAKVYEKNKDFAEISFDKPGEYELIMTTRKGNCEAYKAKKILVTNEEFPDSKPVIKEKFDVTVYPNPSKGNFKVDVKLEKESLIKIKIYALHNNVLLDSRSEQGKKEYSFDFSLSGISAGTYFILFESNQGSQVKKIIIE